MARVKKAPVTKKQEVVKTPAEVVEEVVESSTAFSDWWEANGKALLIAGHGSRSIVHVALHAAGNSVKFADFIKDEKVVKLITKNEAEEVCKLAFKAK